MDEVFGAENFVSQISFKKTGTSTDDELSAVCDYLIHYAKSKMILNLISFMYLKSRVGQEAKNILSLTRRIKNLFVE